MSERACILDFGPIEPDVSSRLKVKNKIPQEMLMAALWGKFDQGDFGVLIAFEIRTIKSDRLGEAYLGVQK